MIVGPMVEERVDFPETDVFDWTSLPDDAAITIFSNLNRRDQVSLSSTCRSLRAVRCRSLQAVNIHPNYCDAKAASSLASRCQQLNRLWISGVCKVDANTINAFAENCKDLTDIGFIDCGKVDETALGNVLSVRFISVAGTTDLNWNLVVQRWSKLPCLIGLDVSRTDVTADTFSGFFSYSFSLKVLCALDCPELNEDATFVSNHYYKGTVLVSFFTDILKSVAMCNKNSDQMSDWLERVVSSSLERESECNPWGLGFNQGTDLLLGFLESENEEVQERAVTALANYSTYDRDHRFDDDDEWPELALRSDDDTEWAESAMRGGDGIRLLLNLAQSWQEGIRSKAAMVIANVSVNVEVAKAVLDEGGIWVLANLATSGDSWAIRALVQLIFIRHHGVREEAAYALWDLSCEREEVVEACGVKVLVAFAKSCTNAPPQLQWRAAGFLWFLSRPEAGRIAICEEGGVSPLLALAKSDDNAYATATLWRLAFCPINAFRIIEEGGIDTIARLSSSRIVSRLFSALALTYMFDQGMDEFVRLRITFYSVELERVRRIATEHIEAFVKTVYSDSQIACIPEVGELFCSEAEIGRFVAMLQNPCPAAVKSCIAFALSQFTVFSAKCGAVHVTFLRNAGAQSVLQQLAAAEDELLETKIFARQVLRNMEWFSYSGSGHPDCSVCWLNHTRVSMSNRK